MSRWEISESERRIEHEARKLAQQADREANIPSTLMFYGYGQAAEAAVQSIVTRMRANRFRHPIKTIYLVGNDKNKLPSDAQKTRWRIELDENQHRIAQPHVTFLNLLTSEVPKYIDNVDLFFLTADCAPPHVEDRIERCRYNRQLIPEVNQLVRSNRRMRVHITSALGEVHAYALADDNPYRFSAEGQTDKNRLDYLIATTLKSMGKVERTDAWVAGHHNNPWPVINGMRVDFGDGFVKIDGDLEDRVPHEMTAWLHDHPRGQMSIIRCANLQKSPTPKETGEATGDFTEAMINGNILINAGMYTDNGLFLQGPTTIQDGYAKPNRTLVNRQNENDRKETGIRKHELESIIKTLGVRKRLIVPVQWEEAEPGQTDQTGQADQTAKREQKQQQYRPNTIEPNPRVHVVERIVYQEPGYMSALKKGILYTAIAAVAVTLTIKGISIAAQGISSGAQKLYKTYNEIELFKPTEWETRSFTANGETREYHIEKGFVKKWDEIIDIGVKLNRERNSQLTVQSNDLIYETLKAVDKNKIGSPGRMQLSGTEIEQSWLLFQKEYQKLEEKKHQ